MIPPAPDELADEDAAYALIAQNGQMEVLLAVSRDRDALVTADRVTAGKIPEEYKRPGDDTTIRRIAYVRGEVAEEYAE